MVTDDSQEMLTDVDCKGETVTDAVTNEEGDVTVVLQLTVLESEAVTDVDVVVEPVTLADVVLVRVGVTVALTLALDDVVALPVDDALTDSD